MATESPGDALALAGDLKASRSVRLWRIEQLERAGYDLDAAVRLAERPDIDLHHARELLEQGCPQELALRILL